MDYQLAAKYFCGRLAYIEAGKGASDVFTFTFYLYVGSDK